MHGVSKSTIHIPSIDLTEDGEFKQELTLENECTSTTCKYTFRILIENEVCSYVIKINKRFFFFIRFRRNVRNQNLLAQQFIIRNQLHRMLIVEKKKRN
jgi:hypothetical protein